MVFFLFLVLIAFRTNNFIGSMSDELGLKIRGFNVQILGLGQQENYTGGINLTGEGEGVPPFT